MSSETNAAWAKLQAIAHGAVAIAPNLLIAAVVFLIFVGLARLLARGASDLARRAGQNDGVAKVFARIASGLLLVLGALIAATIVFPSLDAASIFGALGVGGVAVGFAFKDIFQNLLAGILVLITKPFKIGDQIVSGSHEGTVEDIQIRATLLRTYDNRRIVIPNSELYTNRVTVNTAHPSRRIAVEVGIGYGDDIDLATRVILETIEGLDRVQRDPKPVVLVRELAESSVNLEVRFWINPAVRREAIRSSDEILRAIKPALTEAGIDLPFPTQQILFHDQTETADGERMSQREGWPSRGARDDPRSREAERAEARADGPAA